MAPGIPGNISIVNMMYQGDKECIEYYLLSAINKTLVNKIMIDNCVLINVYLISSQLNYF